MREFQATVLLIACFLVGCSSPQNLNYPSQSPLSISDAAKGCAGYFEARSENIKDGVGQWHQQLFAHAVSQSNSDPLDGTTITLGSDTVYWNSTTTKPNLTNWHREQVWNFFRGGEKVYSDSLASPRIFGIVLPKELMSRDTVSKSGGFLISYTEPGCDSVTIYLRSNQRLGHLLDKNIPLDTTTVTFLSAPTSDSNGYYTVQAKDLANFPAPGIIQVTVIGQNSKYGMVHGDRYLFRSTNTAMLNTFLKP